MHKNVLKQLPRWGGRLALELEFEVHRHGGAQLGKTGVHFGADRRARARAGASAPQAARSATRPIWGRPSRLRASGCGRSPSPMSSSHGENRCTPGDLTIRWTRRSRTLAADSWGGLECRWQRSSKLACINALNQLLLGMLLLSHLVKNNERRIKSGLWQWWWLRLILPRQRRLRLHRGQK